MGRSGKTIYLALILFIGISLGSVATSSHNDRIQSDNDDFESEIQEPDNDYEPPKETGFVQDNFVTSIAKNTNNFISSILNGILNLIKSIVNLFFG